MSLPLNIPGETKTEIIKMKVDEKLAHFEDRVHAVIPDGVFPGTQELPPQQRLVNYLQMTEAIQDLPLLMNLSYFDLLQQGQAPPLQSPRWVTALSIPNQFKEMQKDFIHLLESRLGR